MSNPESTPHKTPRWFIKPAFSAPADILRLAIEYRLGKATRDEVVEKAKKTPAGNITKKSQPDVDAAEAVFDKIKERCYPRLSEYIHQSTLAWELQNVQSLREHFLDFAEPYRDRGDALIALIRKDLEADGRFDTLHELKSPTGGKAFYVRFKITESGFENLYIDYAEQRGFADHSVRIDYPWSFRPDEQVKYTVENRLDRHQVTAGNDMLEAYEGYKAQAWMSEQVWGYTILLSEFIRHECKAGDAEFFYEQSAEALIADIGFQQVERPSEPDQA
jgi:hypothetical protein